MTTRTLEGKTAFVTGGSRGVGAGIVSRLAEEGAQVAFTYANSEDHAKAVVAAAAAAGGIAHAIHADSMKEQDIASAVAQTVDRFGSLDIVVNNAAVGTFGPLDELKMDAISTKALVEMLDRLGLEGKVMLVLAETDEVIRKSARFGSQPRTRVGPATTSGIEITPVINARM